MGERVVFLINSLDGGGAERVVSTLLNNLIEDYECYLILLEGTVRYDLDDRIKIFNLKESVLKSGALKFIRLPLIAYKLSRIIRENKFNTVVSFLHRANYANVIAKYMSNHKAILSERIATTSYYNGGASVAIVNRFLVRILYSRADAIISVSNFIKYDLKNNFGINVQQKVIYNPYDIANIVNQSKESVGFDIVREKSIITVGSLQPRKNISLLLNSFSKIKDKQYRLFILGTGEDENKLKELARALDIEKRVSFLGFVNNPYKFLSKCGIFVLSSNSEGFPNVLAEAMVCGCSVISTDCLSGPREILSPKSEVGFQIQGRIEFAEFGVIVPVNDELNLTNAIDSMSRELQQSYAFKSKLRINDFKLKDIKKEYIKMIESLATSQLKN